MYFYNHKFCKHENEQTQLLEVFGNACFRYRNGGYIYAITIITYFNLKVADGNVCNLFKFYLNHLKHDK